MKMMIKSMLDVIAVTMFIKKEISFLDIHNNYYTFIINVGLYCGI